MSPFPPVSSLSPPSGIYIGKSSNVPDPRLQEGGTKHEEALPAR